MSKLSPEKLSELLSQLSSLVDESEQSLINTTLIELNKPEINNENTIYLHYTGAPDPCDEVAIGLPKGIDIYVSRYKEIFKVQKEHTFIGAVSTCCSHLLLRYCCVKFGIGDWGWTTFRIIKILRDADSI